MKNVTKIQQKSNIKTKLKILKLLKVLPQSTYEISKSADCSYKTALKSLVYLEQLGKIERYRIDALDKELWQIKKKSIKE